MEDSITIIVATKVSVDRLRDLLCSAIEGGSTYWADFSHQVNTRDGMQYESIVVEEQESHLDDVPRFNSRIAAIDLGHGLTVLAGCAGRGGKYLDGKEFPAARRHLDSFLTENDDAETADVILQLTVFGELIYG